MAMCSRKCVQPRIEVTTNTFKLVPPNMNASDSVAQNVPETIEKVPVIVTPQMKTVMV